MNEFYEWQKHEFYENGKHAYTYYAMVIPTKGNKVAQLEFDLEPETHFNIDMYIQDTSSIEILPASDKLKNKFNHIIHENSDIKKRIFNFIFKELNS